jgi:hypothetical protein
LAGWHAGSRLAQVGARTLVGAGCTIVTPSIATRRGGSRVATGFVVAADAISGFSIVTTRVPPDVNAVAVILELSARVGDDRGDVLELGLSGAHRVNGPDGRPQRPFVIAAGGRRISVFAVERDPGATQIEVTVASGEHVYLGGVIGARQGAAGLAESLSRRDLASLIGLLVEPGPGKARVRWLPQRAERFPNRPPILPIVR